MRRPVVIAGLALFISTLACNGEIDSRQGDGGVVGDGAEDGALLFPDGGAGDGSSCGSLVSCNGLCCKAGEICYGDACVVKGNACTMHSDCPFNYFCDPWLLVCLPKKAAFCQYKPPVGKFTPKVEWTWTGSKTALTNHFDVLAPPVVVHLTDDNKDGKLGVGDIPDIVMVTYPDITNHTAPILRDGVLRALSGETGKELWSVTAKTQRMIAGASVATGDLDGDGKPEIVGVDANFYIKAFSAAGKLLWTSDQVVASHEASTKPWNGWGGGIGIADLDADGTPEIFFDASVFSSKGKLRWRKKNGGCAAPKCNFGPLSTAANLDGDAKGTLELVAGNKVYSHDGKLLWTGKSPDGYPAVADFFSDKDPEVILVADGELYIFDGKTGKLEWGPIKFPYPASGDAAKAGPGGPPTVADFDGDGRPEVGVAGGYYYVVFDPDCKKGATKALCASGATNGILWKKASKDLSSRATGSSVFDFEGDGKAEVVYSDECFLRVYDGTTGKVLFQWSNNTRTATEAPIVADVDGDGRAEIVMVSNRRVWNCDTDYPKSWKKPPGYKQKGDPGYHGITVLGDKSDNWVGTRRIWNQHAYHVSNVCDGIDQVCATAQNAHAAVPSPQTDNWSVPWLNNFRQNVQGLGLFNAPDLTTSKVTVAGGCSKEHTSVTFTVTNKGSAEVAAGLKVTLYFNDPTAGGTALKTVATTKALLPGTSETLTVIIKLPATYGGEAFELYVSADDVGDGTGERNECDENNNTAKASVQCTGPG